LWGEELRPTSMPSFILIHPTVCPQYTNITDRQTDRKGQDRRDNGAILYSEPFYKRSPKNYPKKQKANKGKRHEF